jgi:hypothetical protein
VSSSAPMVRLTFNPANDHDHESKFIFEVTHE